MRLHSLPGGETYCNWYLAHFCRICLTSLTTEFILEIFKLLPQ